MYLCHFYGLVSSLCYSHSNRIIEAIQKKDQHFQPYAKSEDSDQPITKILKTRNIFEKDKRRKRYWNMNIETTLWFNMKRRMPLKYKLYYEFKQNQESLNTV